MSEEIRRQFLTIGELLDANESLRAEVEALKADNKRLRGEFEKAWPDAERFRWIFEQYPMDENLAWMIAGRESGFDLRKAIDMARAKQADE